MQTLFREKKLLFWKISNCSFLIIWLQPKVLIDNLVATFFFLISSSDFSNSTNMALTFSTTFYTFQWNSCNFKILWTIFVYNFHLSLLVLWPLLKINFSKFLLIYLLKKITFPFNIIIYIFKLYNFCML